jgi:hypothetical protein
MSGCASVHSRRVRRSGCRRITHSVCYCYFTLQSRENAAWRVTDIAHVGSIQERFLRCAGRHSAPRGVQEKTSACFGRNDGWCQLKSGSVKSNSTGDRPFRAASMAGSIRREIPPLRGPARSPLKKPSGQAGSERGRKNAGPFQFARTAPFEALRDSQGKKGKRTE